jgi:7-keto-8-aminopelargonate synthetase-like enzyme
LLALFERNARSARAAGVFGLRIEDQVLDGGYVTIRGQRLVNFGSCAYLALNTDRRLKDGAIAAIERFGPVFSSSTGYTSVDLYTHLEQGLRQIYDSHVLVPTTTTLGHLAALPALVGEDDLVLVDTQAHSTVHLATQILMAEGITVTPIGHNDMDALASQALERAQHYRHVWYLADSVYSMFGDVAPVPRIMELVDSIPNMYAYFDDAHGFGWRGKHGRGVVLDLTPWHERLVVAASLAKSFGSGGAVLAFGDQRLAERVQLSGGTMIFSGPIHPAELGAAVASCAIHLSDELVDRQEAMAKQIDFVRRAAVDADIPLANASTTPIWFVKIGGTTQALQVARRMMDRGFFLNYAAFPAVPAGQSGLRFTHTLYHSEHQIVSMIDALQDACRAVMGDTEIVIDLTDRTAPKASG